MTFGAIPSADGVNTASQVDRRAPDRALAPQSALAGMGRGHATETAFSGKGWRLTMSQPSIAGTGRPDQPRGDGLLQEGAFRLC